MIEISNKDWHIALGRITNIEKKIDKIIWILTNNQISINKYPEPSDYEGKSNIMDDKVPH